MPDYLPWDMSDETRRQLSERMREGMYAGVPPGDAAEELVRQVGRDALIEQLAGTTDRRSREWRNARDNLSRWRRGARHPRAESQQRMRAAAENQRRGQIRDSGRAHVSMQATFRTSKNTWGRAEADLTGPDLDGFMAAHEAGDDEQAAQIITDAYGLDPSFVLGMEGITGFTINWDEPEAG